MIYSYSNLNTYLNCPHQFYRRYVKKDVPFVETEATSWGNAVHKAFEVRLKGGKPLPQNMAQWEPFALSAEGAGNCYFVELQLGITKEGGTCDFWNGAHIRGKLDYVALSNNQAPTKAYMLDWKTGKPWEKSFELRVGAMLLKAAYPALERIVGAYVWLRHNEIGEQHELSDTELTRVECDDIINQVEHDAKHDKWAKTPGVLCRWCDVKDCEFNRK